jgi:GntR family transcriptional regulator, transcriptional repressor for pyruvate dehydrogenase complex
MQSTTREKPKKSPPTDESTVPLQPLYRQNLVAGVVESLRERILAGAFDTAEPLPSEAQLGQQLAVSRTVIREAMRILGGQGLVEVSQGRRPRIRPADSQAVVDSISTFLQRQDHTPLDLIEVRRPLETAIAALAAERATPHHLQAMEEAIEQQRTVSGLPEQVAADMRFHDLLAEATGNPVFQLLLKTLASLMRQSRHEVLGRIGVERGVEGHTAILAALRAKDPNAASKAMQEHLAHAREDLIP